MKARHTPRYLRESVDSIAVVDPVLDTGRLVTEDEIFLQKRVLRTHYQRCGGGYRIIRKVPEKN